MTTALATDIWWWYLLTAFVVWFVIEIGLIVWAHLDGQKNDQTWTLSDTIRRWAASRRWLALLYVGIASALAWHFFLQPNLPGG